LEGPSAASSSASRRDFKAACAGPLMKVNRRRNALRAIDARQGGILGSSSVPRTVSYRRRSASFAAPCLRSADLFRPLRQSEKIASTVDPTMGSARLRQKNRAAWAACIWAVRKEDKVRKPRRDRAMLSVAGRVRAFRDRRVPADRAGRPSTCSAIEFNRSRSVGEGLAVRLRDSPSPDSSAVPTP